jgi:NADH:ubiquinone oxidoreductase subunit 5 (subunit L)/multisubunit Na+/H+ antiporter MnhA subunit
MDSLVVLMPLLPLCAALIIGLATLSGILVGAASEAVTTKLSLIALTFSTLVGLSLLVAEQTDKISGAYLVGTWLSSEALSISLGFITFGFNLRSAVLCALLLLVIARFSVNQLHRETGYHRFFFVFNLFAAAMFLTLLSNNMLVTFIGWQLISVCAYLMCAYAYEQPVATFNATRIFMTNRVGDAGFLLGIGLSYSWIGSFSWTDLKLTVVDLGLNESTTLALCFATAAFAKSAQLPFAAWLARSMEGPTASSAAFFGGVSIHSGVFLIIALRAVFEQSAIAMSVLVLMGALTALYGYVVSLTQTDIKSSLSFAITGQLGLMFVECGFGLWQLAAWHTLVHALIRSYQLLNAPGFMQQVRGIPVPLLMPRLAKLRWAYVVSLQRFWLDPLTDWMLVNPVLRLGKDLSYFDDHIVNAAMGVPAPAMNALSTLAQLEEQRIGAQLDNDTDSFARGSGLAGKLAEASAGVLHWVEDRLVIRGVHEDAMRYGHHVGMIANRIEQLLLRPRYLSLFVFITLLAVF